MSTCDYLPSVGKPATLSPYPLHHDDEHRVWLSPPASCAQLCRRHQLESPSLVQFLHRLCSETADQGYSPLASSPLGVPSHKP